MVSESELSISFFFVHEECSYKTESVRPQIFTAAMATISEKLTLIHLQQNTHFTDQKDISIVSVGLYKSKTKFTPETATASD